MSGISDMAARPDTGIDPPGASRYRSVGLGLALLGLMGTVVAFAGNLTAATAVADGTAYQDTLAWTFGLSIFSFGVVKLAIAVVLMGIIVRLWVRVDSIKESLVRLRGDSSAPTSQRGDVTTAWGQASISDAPPKLLPIHRMARTMWRPMLAMGAMGITAGLISSFVWVGQEIGSESFRKAAAFTQGIEFLGETFLLSGIAFLLGTILAGLRTGGGEVQSSLGLPVTTLKMPASAKAFVGLMMMGLMTGIGQFVLYLVAMSHANDPASFSSYLNWLGPLRELALGLILAGIVLALVSIGNVLAFQFNRVNTIIRTGA